MRKTLLTGKFTPPETEYSREQKRILKEGRETWDLLFSVSSEGLVEDIERELREETDRFVKKHGIDRVRASRFKRLERERKANRSTDI